MSRQDPAEVEQRLEAGERLRIGDLMTLFGASRSAVDRWLRNGVKYGDRRIWIHYWIDPSGDRLCDPKDVREVLSEFRKRRVGYDPEGRGLPPPPEGPASSD